MTLKPQSHDARVTHRAETIRQIILPIAGGATLIVIALIILLLLQRRVQVSVIANLMMTVMLLCPMVICMIPLCVITLFMALGMSNVHDSTAGLVRRVTGFSYSLISRVKNITDRLNKASINFSTRMEQLLNWLTIFERHTDSKEDKK